MPEANEAPDLQVNYEDDATRELAELVDARAAEIAAEEDTGADEASESREDAQVTQAEEATASGESDEVEAASTGDGDAVETTDDSPDLGWVPDGLRDPISQFLKTANEEQLAALEDFKRNALLGRGGYAKMREAAELRKESEALIAAGEQFNKLFEDESERDLYLEWRARRDERGTDASSDLDPESFETDADLIRHAEKRAQEAAERRFQELYDERFEKPKAAAQSFTSLLEDHFKDAGVSQELYIEAAGMLNAKLRKRGIEPMEYLSNLEVLDDELQPYLDLVSMRTQIQRDTADAVSKNERSKSQAARSASASSPVGRSTRAREEYPEDPKGLAARTLAEFDGLNISEF